MLIINWRDQNGIAEWLAIAFVVQNFDQHRTVFAHTPFYLLRQPRFGSGSRQEAAVSA